MLSKLKSWRRRALLASGSPLRPQTLFIEPLESRVLLSASAVTDGLVAHWPGEIVGGVVIDAWGDNDGVPVNGAATTPGLEGNAFRLAGSDTAPEDAAYIQLPESFDSHNMTVAAWVYATDVNPVINSLFANRLGGCVASVDTDGTALYINQFGTANRTLIMEYGDANIGCQVFQPLPGDIADKVWLNTWTFVAQTIENGVARLYIDGALVNESAAPLNRTLSNKPARIGSVLDAPGVASFPFTGLIDEVTIHNRALSLAELDQLAAPDDLPPGTVIFEDHFDGAALDTAVWHINDGPMARSYLNGQPEVAGGIVTLPLETYNPDYPGVHLMGTQFDSLRYFQRGEGVEFEARVRIDEMPSGAVPAFFTLGRHIYNNQEFIDEVDFEYLTKSINNAAPGAEPVLNTSWNDINLTVPQSPLPPEVYSSDEINVAGLELSDWNTFTMRWLPGRVEWLVNGEVTKTETVAVPDDPMKVWLGIWVPAEAWPAAYSPDLQPAATVGSNERWTMQVDYVIVRTPQASGTDITFDDVTTESNFESLIGGEYLHAAAWGDVNGDGFADMFAPKFNGFGYPDFGPARLLINNGDGTFHESVQPALNISNMAVSGTAFADFDNDGDVDLVVGSFNPGGAGPHYSRIYENDGLGNFTDRTDSTNFARAELANMPTRTPFTFDYDGDGDLDVLLQHDVYNGSVYQSRLMRNDGNFAFTEVTAAAGLPVYVGPGNEGLQGLGGAVGDFDGDGDPDFIFPSPLFRAPNYNTPNSKMFLNDGDGTFSVYPHNAVFNNKTDWDPVINDDWYVGAAAGDLNNDGLLDLVMGQHFVSAPSNAYGQGPHPSSVRVFLNQGNDGNGVPIFLDVTDTVGIDKIHTIQAHVEIQDMDNDGDMDIVTSATMSDAWQGGEQRPVIYRNTLVETGNLGFALNAGMDPATNSGDWLNDLARDPYYYPGAPTVDFDRDGKLDIMGQEAISNFITTTGTRPSPLFRNTSGEGNHWLEVEVDASSLPNVNRDGIGATVKIYEAGHLGDPAHYLGLQELQVTDGYSSGTEPIAHFGLGARDAVDIEVVLPWGAGVWTRENVSSNQRIEIGAGGRIGDRVWHDLNANGLQDEGEPGVFGATVELHEGGGIATAVIATTTTDYDGEYVFSGLPAGNYRVHVVAADWTGVSPLDVGGDDTIDSDFIAVGGPRYVTAVDVTIGEDESIFNIDAGLVGRIVRPVDEPVGPTLRASTGLTMWHLGHNPAYITEFHQFVASEGYTPEQLVPAASLQAPASSHRILLEPELLPAASLPGWPNGWTVGGPGNAYITSGATDAGPDVTMPLHVDADGLYRLWVQFYGYTTGTAVTRIRIYETGNEDAGPVFEDEIYDYAVAVQGPNWKDALVELEAGDYTVTLSHVTRWWHAGTGPAGYSPRQIDAIYLTDEIWAAPPDAAARTAMRNASSPVGIQWTQTHTLTPGEQDSWETWALRPTDWDHRDEQPLLFDVSYDFWRSKVDEFAALDYVGGVRPDYRTPQRQIIFDERWNMVSNPVLIQNQIDALTSDVTVGPQAFVHERMYAGYFDTVTGGWERDGEWLRATYQDFQGTAADSYIAPEDGMYYVWVRFRNINYHAPWRVTVSDEDGGVISFDRNQQLYPKDLGTDNTWQQVGVLAMDAGEVMDFLISPLLYINPGTYRGIHAFEITTDPNYIPQGTTEAAISLAQYEQRAIDLGGDLADGYMAWFQDVAGAHDPYAPLAMDSWPLTPIPAAPSTSIVMARDSYASDTVFLRSLSTDSVTLDVQPGPLVGVNGSFDGHVEWSVTAFAPYDETREGWSPFMLLQRPDITVPALNVAGIWFTIDSMDVPPGDYTSEVVLSAAGLPDQTVTLNVHVSPIEIAPQTPILASGWSRLIEGDAYRQDAVDHGLNVGYGELMTKAQMEERGIKLLYINNGSNDAAAIQSRIDFLLNNGVGYDDFVMAVKDEPSGTTQAALQSFIDIANTIHSIDPNVNVIFNPGEAATLPTFEILDDYTDWWNPYSIHLLGHPSYAQARTDLFSQKPYMWYSTPVLYDKSPALPRQLYDQFRAVPAQPGDIRGTAFFAFNYPFRDHWDTAYEHLPDVGVTVLPSRHGPIPTRVEEAMREGIQHANLAQMVKEHPAAINNPAAQTLIASGTVTELLDWLEAQIAPTVTSVMLHGSAWTTAFDDHLAAANMGQGGFAVPVGSVAQLTPSPWNNVNELIVRFSLPVDIQQGDLTLVGLLGPDGVDDANDVYTFSGFTTRIGATGDFEAVWTLPAPIAQDWLQLTIDGTSGGAVRVAGGELLDGDWVNSTTVYPSGNGTAGGDFVFEFAVLPGDANRNGAVNVFDSVDVRGRWNSSTTVGNYSPFADINGNGAINVFDSLPVRAAWNTAVPINADELVSDLPSLQLAPDQQVQLQDSSPTPSLAKAWALLREPGRVAALHAQPAAASLLASLHVEPAVLGSAQRWSLTVVDDGDEVVIGSRLVD